MGRLLRSLSSLENRIIYTLANPGFSGVFSYGSLTVSSYKYYYYYFILSVPSGRLPSAGRVTSPRLRRLVSSPFAENMSPPYLERGTHMRNTKASKRSSATLGSRHSNTIYPPPFGHHRRVPANILRTTLALALGGSGGGGLGRQASSLQKFLNLLDEAERAVGRRESLHALAVLVDEELCRRRRERQ
eukprot:1186515-Prorocentrum_minimum.AAC.7